MFHEYKSRTVLPHILNEDFRIHDETIEVYDYCTNEERGAPSNDLGILGIA